MRMNFERELDQFYTNKDIALQCYELLKGLLKEHNIKPSIWLEPSAGAGAFFSIIEEEKLGIDIDPKIENVVKSDFLEYDLQNEEYITIGNPPFGKNASLAIKFFNKCALSSQVVAFIVPKTFKKGSVQNKLDKNMHLVFEWDVPVNSFNIKKEIVDVPCVFQVWIKSLSYVKNMKKLLFQSILHLQIVIWLILLFNVLGPKLVRLKAQKSLPTLLMHHIYSYQPHNQKFLRF